MTTTQRTTTPATEPPATSYPHAGRPTPIRPSTFAIKVTMAITGLIFVAFVFVHMYGNLHIYQGQAEFDHYAHWLRELLMPLLPYEGVLWMLRVVLSLCLVLHVAGAAILAARAKKARGPHRRAGLRRPRSLLASSMLGTGIVLLLFVIFHILDLTVGLQPAAPASFEAGSAYANLVASFQRPVVALAYLVTMLALTAHVAHGVWTAANDLGATGRRLRQVSLWLGGLVAIAICIGNASIPIAVMLGLLR